MKPFTTTLLLLLSYISFAQDEIVVFTAKIFNESNKPLKEVIINTYKNDTLFRSDTTKSNGKVSNIILPTGSNYRIVIEKQGYVSKMADIDAHFKTEFDLWTETPMRFDVALFEECGAGDYEFMKTEPLIRFQFDSTGFFKYDKAHLKKMIRKVEFAKYGNLSTEDHETFSNNYFGGLELMEFEKYDEGLIMLMKAKEIVDCPYVIAKIDECKQFQKTQVAYNKFVARADSLYAIEKYREAGNVYKIASNIKPNERYPAKQLALIQYHKVVAKANKYFEEKDYESALKYYDRAARLKPDDISFKKKHKKCQRKVK